MLEFSGRHYETVHFSSCQMMSSVWDLTVCEIYDTVQQCTIPSHSQCLICPLLQLSLYTLKEDYTPLDSCF